MDNSSNKKRLRDLRHNYKQKTIQNYQSDLLLTQRWISQTKYFHEHDLFDVLPNEFQFDPDSENSIRIKYLLECYRKPNIFIWVDLQDCFDVRKIKFGNETLNLYSPKSDIGYDVWKRNVVFFSYENFTTEYTSCMILKMKIYGLKVFHNEIRHVYLDWEQRSRSKLWGIDEDSFLGFHPIFKSVKGKRRSNDVKEKIEFFKLCQEKYGRIQDMMSKLVDKSDSMVI